MQNSYNKVNVEAALASVHSRIKSNRRKRIMHAVTSCAAALALPLLCSTVYLAMTREHPDNTVRLVEVKSTPGIISNITLPDGSEVWLNSNTTLSYPSAFTEKDRDVYLQGEAFFKVSKENGRKFNVITDGVTVEVVGTEFNVEAYAGDVQDVRTTLVNGKVNMYCNNTQGETICHGMIPGQRLTYNKTSAKTTYEDVNPLTSCSWKDGYIVLDDTSLSDALRLVGNRFNVKFIINNDKLLTNRYTGSFTNQRLDVVLEYFKKTTRIHFEPTSDGMTYIVH